MKEVTIGGRKVLYLEEGAGEPLVLLHGWSFNSDDWVRSGIFHMFAKHFKVYTVEMPYGLKTRSDRFTAARREYAKFLRQILDGLELKDPPLVGPSASGEVVLWYVALGLPTRAAVVIGAVGLTTELLTGLSQSKTPILAIWGDRDHISPPDNARLLQDRAKVVIFKKAGHAAYLDKPEEFVAVVLEFLREVSQGLA
ncbi:MAG: alpha/beta fold hydrolase [Pyrobaculum sp.]